MIPDGGSDDAVRAIHGQVAVETPEQIEFTFDLAGPGPRVLAYLIDLSIRSAAVAFAGLLILSLLGWASPGLASGILLLMMFAVEWGYHTLLEWRWRGATPGKKALRLRVVRTDGVALDFGRAALRNLLRAADLFPFAYATGLLAMFLGGQHRRLGDLAADTMVIREEPARLRDLPPLPDDVEPLPHGIVGSLGLGRRDLALIDEFFRRRHLFSFDRSRELAGVLAAPIAARLGLAEHHPEELLASVLLAGHELRTSWHGRVSAVTLPPPAPGGAR